MSGAGSCRDNLDTWLDNLPDKEVTKEQPMSDTLQEGEEQMSEHQVTKSGTCVIPGCPCRGWSAQEEANVRKESTMGDMTTVSTCNKCGDSYRESLVFRHECRKEVSEHQPVARGGGNGDKWSIKVHGNEIDADLLVNGSYVGTLHVDKAKQVLAEHNQHQSLVAERESLARILKAILDDLFQNQEQVPPIPAICELYAEGRTILEAIEQRTIPQ